jgi:chemosensory pili system protein ChpC
VNGQRELYSLLIPLRRERLLVPRMCVAEVIPFADTERRPDENAPGWLLGSIDWNGRRLPVVSFDSDQEGDETRARRKAGRSRVVVFHTIGDKLKSSHFGILTQGFPQLVRVNPDVISAATEEPVPEGQPVLCRVRMIHEFPLVPDLECIESMIADWQAGVAD